MTTMTATADNSQVWRTSLFAGIVTAVAALLMALTTGMAIVPAIFGLLVGAAPIIGVQLAGGNLGDNWRPVIAGVIGNILFVVGILLPVFQFGPEAFGLFAPILGILSMIIWPIVVGAMSPGLSVGRLLLFSLLGLVLAVVVALLILNFIGQNPNQWPEPVATFFWAVWGGTVGAAMARGAV